MQLDLLPPRSRSAIPRGRNVSPYTTYEALKAAWLDKFPGATPAEYAAACNRIARELGL